mgnify:FL=1
MSWKQHSSKAICKANSMLGLLKRSSGENFSAPAQWLLYLALVRSHLDYGSEAWSGQSIEVIRPVEAVQR